MNEGRNPFEKGEFETDKKKLFFKFISHWKLYVLCVLLALIGAYLFLQYASPLYKVHAQVLIEQSQDNSTSSPFMQSSMLQDFSGLFNTENNVNDELAILKTRDLLEKVVADLQLNIIYQKRGVLSTVELYKNSPFRVNYISSSDSVKTTKFNVLFPNNGNSNSYELESKDFDSSLTINGHFGDTVATPIGQVCLAKTGMPFNNFKYAFTIVSPDELIEGLTSNISMDIPDKQTDVITLDYITNVPAKGEAVLNKLISVYIDRNINEKDRISDSALSFINSRITLVADDLNNVEANIQNFKQSNNLADITSQSQQLITSSSTYLDKLNEVEVQLNVVESMLNYVQDEKNNSRPMPALLNTDPTFVELVNKYNSALVERDRLSLTIQENNPIIANTDVQIRNLRQDIIRSLQSQQRALQTSKNQLSSETNQFNSLIKGVPAQERRYVNLSRERDVKQALYLYLLQKKEETAISKASNIPSASVIAKPKSEYRAYFPKKAYVFGIALFIGLAAATSLVILKNALSMRIQTKEEIEEHTSVPILAEVSHSDNPQLGLSGTDDRSVISEQFRLLRTKMDFIVPRKKCTKVVITSFMPSEGKSFVAANLAHIFAIAGKKVLLMELDLRKPKLSKMFNMVNNTGFTKYVIEQGPFKNYIAPLPNMSNIYLMGSGPIPPNPGELLISPEVPELFNELEKHFDLIVIDSPPVGAVADARVLMQYSDLNLYVIRQKYTYKNSLATIKDLIENENLTNLYLVVNDVKKQSGYRYGYGYGYEYGYGYSEANEGKKKFLKKIKS